MERIIKLINNTVTVMWCPVLAWVIMYHLSFPYYRIALEWFPVSLPFWIVYCHWVLAFTVIVALLKIRGPLRDKLALYPFRPSLTFTYVLLALSVGFLVGMLVHMMQEHGLYPENALVELIFILMASCPYGIAAMILVGPVVEEIVFRGVLLNRLLQRMGTLPALLISAALFSLWHMNMYQIPYTFVMGLVLGLVFTWSRSLWPPIVMHVVNNAMTLLPEELMDAVDLWPTAGQVGLIALTAVISLAMLRHLKRYAAPAPDSREPETLGSSNVGDDATRETSTD